MVSSPEQLSIESVKQKIFEWVKSSFANPAELLAWLDDDLMEGKYRLHKWQATIHTKEFAKVYTAQDPLDLNLRAVNGSGKDEKVIAPFALWIILTQAASRVVVTSASSRQLDTQTKAYLHRYGNLVNKKLSEVFNLPEPINFLIVQDKTIICTFAEDSEILMFVTDDPGKAEGYHPIKAGATFVMLMNECKSISDVLFEALSRCNGYTHWIEVSSPGKPDGHFFMRCSNNDTITFDGIEKPAIVQYIVRADDCPHLGGELYKLRIAREYGSKDHYMYKSLIDCEFSSTDEQVVIPVDIYDRLIQYQNIIDYVAETKNTGGLDLAFGGDEIVLNVRNGNKHLGSEKLISKDTDIICNTIKSWFIKWKLEDSIVYADAGGLGDVIISRLRGDDFGFKKIVRIKNNWTSSNETAWDNLGCESWFRLRNLIEDLSIIIQDEKILRGQLVNRYYKIKPDNSAILESKSQARGKGRTSPDRADSLVLCFYKYKTPKVIQKKEDRKKKLDEAIKLGIFNNFRVSIKNILNRNNKEKDFKERYNYTGINIAPGGRINNTSDLRRELKQNLQEAMKGNKIE